MNLLAYESIDRQIVERLRNDGHDVSYIAELEPSIDDTTVFDRANSKKALLITADKDFGEMVFLDRRLLSDGVVLVRLPGLSPETKARLVSEAFQKQGRNLPNKFTVITPGGIRMRTELSITE